MPRRTRDHKDKVTHKDKPVKVEATDEDSENFYTYFGDQNKDRYSYKLYGTISQRT